MLNPVLATLTRSVRSCVKIPAANTVCLRLVKLNVTPVVRTPIRKCLSTFSRGFANTVVKGDATATVNTAGAAGSVSTSNKIVGGWLLGVAGLTFGTVVVGGVTRLTESGLSITKWEPLRGVRYPSSAEEWEEQFELYKQTPEFKYTNHSMSLEEFKKIYFMEWFHRILGRTIGLTYLVPLAVFLKKGWIKPSHKKAVAAFGLLIGFQGALGWYMVKSGVEHDPQGEHVPRVSHYRLMAHLGTAFALYTGLVYTGLSYLIPHRLTLTGNSINKLRRFAHGTTGIVFLTALSGALVAGLDAGLVYNSWPKFADRWIPEDILRLSPKFKNFFDNPTTVQFDHRLLGYTTACAVAGLWMMARPIPLHPQARLAVNAMLGMVAVQVSLGISTLLYFVPTPLAASHQAGSLTLLTFALWFMHELRRLPKA